MAVIKPKFHYYSSIKRAYVLGFPIHLYTPDENTINEAHIQYCENSDNYLAGITERNKEYFNSIINMLYPHKKCELGVDIILRNPENVLMESIYDYNVCDLVYYFELNNLYVFTRDEWDHLLNSETNPWTNLKLPYIVIKQIEERIAILKTYDIGNCKTVSDLMVKAIKLKKPKPKEPINSYNIFAELYPNMIIDYNVGGPRLRVDAIRRQNIGSNDNDDVPALEDDSDDDVNEDENNRYNEINRDISLVMNQTNCTREAAINSLREANWDIVNAIMILIT